MAIIDIQSANPHLSWVLFKNPETQKADGKPFQKTMRKGNLKSWYKDDQNFRLWFKDGKGESSFYKNINNNYLDQSPFNCAFVYCTMMAEMLSSTIKKEHEKDIACYNKITLSAINITLPTVADFFIHFFADKVKIEKIQLGNKSYSYSFEGEVSLYYLTNLVQVFSLIQSIEDKNIFIDLTPAILIKYANNLKAIDAPYFVVYLFISRCVPDFEGFKVVQPILQKENWILNFGNTQKQRYLAIKKFVQGGQVLHDIGCGELYYSRNLASMYQGIIAWDTDAAIQERNSRFIIKKSIFNVELKSSFNVEAISCIETGQDLLITEMLEHMEKTDASKILTEITKAPFRRLIITMPNSDFNQFYKLSNEFRHDDHCWEPSFLETQEWINNIFDNSQFSIIIKPIGDGIDGIHVSTLIVIDKKEIK